MEDEIQKLKDEIRFLKDRRIKQADIIPQAVKNRHIGEGVPYVAAGLLADRPDGVGVTQGVSCYFATDNNRLYIFNGTTWVSTTLS